MPISEIEENENYYEFEDKETGIKYKLPFEGRGIVSLSVLRSLPAHLRRQVIAALPSNSAEVEKSAKMKKSKKGIRSIRLKNGQEIPFAKSRTYKKKKPQQKFLNSSIPNSHAIMIPKSIQIAKPGNRNSAAPFARVNTNVNTMNAIPINGHAKSRKTTRRTKKKTKSQKPTRILSRILRKIR